MAKKESKHYRHSESKAVLRPEGGAQDIFPRAKRKPPQQYRFDSSLAPELRWDESAARGECEALIAEVLAADSLEKARAAAGKLKSMSAPFLDWAGKAERGEFFTPSLPLFVHERLSVDAVLKTLERHKRDRQMALDMFGEGQKTIGDAISGAYTHLNGWQNRMILGDSLQVMNSLLTYESMGGGVQMVYMDPPYGIKFGSNFQPFVRKREVKDGADESISREPEMVHAYRDTWELGVHSWLTYMRERLLLARELLNDTGSCFVQISDENVHFVRSIMDEVFGRENFVSMITYRTTAGLGSKNLSTAGDYLIWYAKNKDTLKYNQIFISKPFGEGTMFTNIIKANGENRAMNERELQGFIEVGDIPYQSSDLVSSGLTPSCVFDFDFEGRAFAPGRNRSWKTNLTGMKKLQDKNRLHAPGNTLRYVSYWHDFPVSNLTNFWIDAVGELSKQYVVQTSEKIIQRCMLMTTDPGDLVIDPTCGSGTTAAVAEQWGRRWITMDVSRVPLALARQRLLTATYDYYKLKDEKRGPAAGFIYQRKQNNKGEETGGIVPHITLKSIANNEPSAEEVLVDKPEKDSKLVRITGPFCVEAVLPPPLSEENPEQPETPPPEENITHINCMIDSLNQVGKLQLPGNKTMPLKNVRPPAKSMHLHAEAETGEERAALVFGAPDAAVSELAIINAAKEASYKNFARLFVVAFAIEPKARKTAEECEKIVGIPATYVQASTDLTMGDLLKNMRSSQIFAVCGLPDVGLSLSGEKNKNGDNLYRVKLRGLDVFDPATMETEHKSGLDVPCWMLDPDYDGQCFRAGQVFFPRTAAWDKIRKAIKADFAESVWEHLAGDTSAPFAAGENEQIAVKVIDDRGNELIVVKSTQEVGT